MLISKTLDVSRVGAWRTWLKKNHSRARDIWLVYHKVGSGKPRISYNDAVDEAICFGWIDSTVKTLDKDRYCQRFSPRRKGSPFSELNRHRAIRLIKERRMMPAGLKALAGTQLRHPRVFRAPPDILRSLQKDPAAWNNYKRFPESYKRIRIHWIDAARHRPAVFKQRLRHFLKATARNKRFGMLQA